MSFDTEVVKDGRGRVLRIDVSTDKFATTTYRWSDKAGVLDGTNQYDNRIVSLAPIRRGLGQNRIATGATTELVLDNADGVLDALCGHAAISSQAKMRLRIYVALYDPSANPLTFSEKLLGEFTMPEWPERDDATLRLQLGDDVLGPIGQQAALPTLLDWQAVGNTGNNPIFTSMGIPSSISDLTPMQLAFGEDWVHALPHLIPWESPDADYIDHVIVPICCTTDLGAVDQNMVTNLRVRWLGFDEGGDFSANQGEVGERLRDVPRSVIVTPAYGTSAAVTETIWTVEKSPTITKNGKTFQVVYLVVRNHMGLRFVSAAAGNWDTGSLGQYAQLGGYPVNAVAWSTADYRVVACRVIDWYVKGVPLSAITQQTSNVQHAVDVLTDLATHYSNNTSITVNATAAARVKAGNSEASCSGVIQPWTTGPRKGDVIVSTEPPSLRQAISLICQSSDIDAFINWAGEFSFASDVWDYTIATQAGGLISIPETALEPGVKSRIPGPGERWAPFNRLTLKGGKAYDAENLPVPFQGPWDLDAGDEASVALADRIIAATLEQGWRPFRQQAQDPRAWRSLNVKARDAVRFRTHIDALRLDLGDYFKFTWTRGELGGPYAAAIFQLEDIVYAPADDSVEVGAIWRDDTASEDSYLLDDETLLVRSKGVLTGNAQPNDGDVVCDFGGTINLTTMGVVAGDILVLRCTTDAEDDFVGNSAHRITNKVSATEVEVDPPFGIFDTNPIPNAEWYIVKGATTYPTGFATGYIDGGGMYGKATDENGLFSDATTGNRLLSG